MLKINKNKIQKEYLLNKTINAETNWEGTRSYDVPT